MADTTDHGMRKLPVLTIAVLALIMLFTGGCLRSRKSRPSNKMSRSEARAQKKQDQQNQRNRRGGSYEDSRAAWAGSGNQLNESARRDIEYWRSEANKHDREARELQAQRATADVRYQQAIQRRDEALANAMRYEGVMRSLGGSGAMPESTPYHHSIHSVPQHTAPGGFPGSQPAFGSAPQGVPGHSFPTMHSSPNPYGMSTQHGMAVPQYANVPHNPHMSGSLAPPSARDFGSNPTDTWPDPYSASVAARPTPSMPATTSPPPSSSSTRPRNDGWVGGYDR